MTVGTTVQNSLLEGLCLRAAPAPGKGMLPCRGTGWGEGDAAGNAAHEGGGMRSLVVEASGRTQERMPRPGQENAVCRRVYGVALSTRLQKAPVLSG